jgi:3-phosphoinositide dependent protein kinase-1
LKGFHNYNVRKFYVCQLVSILDYLRTKRVVHRDLKPANLLLNENFQLVLADFGTSKVLKDLEVGQPLGLKKSISTTQLLPTSSNLLESADDLLDDEELVGTEEYISPEALENSNQGVSYASDLWSFGVIVWQIFAKTNTTPFADASQEKTFQRIKQCSYSMPEDTPEVAQDLIRKLLLKDPAKRLGADDL